MKPETETKVIVFEDGTFFNGVKGKKVRKTHVFADAKRIDGEISERDLKYLKNENYKLLNAVMTIVFLDGIDKGNAEVLDVNIKEMSLDDYLKGGK